mgnify:CR=1 FL=1
MENRGCFSTWQKYTISIPGTILVALKAAGFKGLIACRRQQYEDVFAEAEFTPVAGRDKRLAVSVYAFEEDDDMLLCCRSEGRAKKEQAIHGKAIARFETDLEKLNTRLAKGRLKAPDKIQQALGRLKERHHRVSRFYTLEVKPAADKQTA